MEKLPTYKIELTDNLDEIMGISLVTYPAIEEDFMKFSKEELPKIIHFSDINKEKQIVTGPALIPNKEIYRVMNGEEFNVYFDEEVIEKIQTQFFQTFKQENISTQHEEVADEVTVMESWIIEDSKNDKANALGFDLPKGTWMVSMKVNNEETWARVKDGELKGFSIEAFLSKILIDAAHVQKDEDIIKVDKLIKEIDVLLNSIKLT